MSVFPTEAEARGFADARALLTWAGVPDAAWAAFEAQVGPVGDLIRNIALLPASTVRTAADAATDPDGVALRPLAKAQIGIVWRIARRLGATSWDAFIDQDLFEDTPIAAPTVASPSGVVTTLATASRKVKLNQVIDQSDETEIVLAEDQLVKKWFEIYRNFAQGPAEAEEEPSIEQLSAVYSRVVTLNKTPWADFAIFTPFSRRLIKANKFKAFIFSRTEPSSARRSLGQSRLTLGCSHGGSSAWCASC